MCKFFEVNPELFSEAGPAGIVFRHYKMEIYI
jgi:hypothetical protein